VKILHAKFHSKLFSMPNPRYTGIAILSCAPGYTDSAERIFPKCQADGTWAYDGADTMIPYDAATAQGNEGCVAGTGAEAHQVFCFPLCEKKSCPSLEDVFELNWRNARPSPRPALTPNMLHVGTQDHGCGDGTRVFGDS
jgi:hypothetical protein